MIPGVPSDNTTLLDVLDELAEQGYTATMWVGANGKIRCEGCAAEMDPADLPVHEFRRLEGASDPDDMLVVVAAVCTACDTKATIVIHYGPESSPEELDALTQFEKA